MDFEVFSAIDRDELLDCWSTFFTTVHRLPAAPSEFELVVCSTCVFVAASEGQCVLRLLASQGPVRQQKLEDQFDEIRRVASKLADETDVSQ